MKPFINYAVTGGYDPDDGLENGRWMYDDERRVQVWVPIATTATKPSRACECGASISKTATRCRPCNLRIQREAAPINPLQLVTCPTCGAKVGQTCRTKGGNRAGAHKERLTPRLCECGSVAARNATMCNPCRSESRRATARAASERYRNKQRSDAA